MCDNDRRRVGKFAVLAFCLTLVSATAVLAQPSAQWSMFYDAGVGGHDIATSITTDHQNYVIVTGCSQESQSGPFDIVTLKLDPNNPDPPVWVKRYGTPSRYDTAVAVVVDSTNNDIYVVGSSQDTSGRFDAVLIKYLPNGDTAFVRRFADPAGQYLASGVALDGSGNIYVGALHRVDATATQFFDITVIKYAPNGDTLWARYNTLLVNNASLLDMTVSMCLDPDGNAVLTAPTKDVAPGSEGQDIVTVKYNPNGDTLWYRQFDGGVHWDDYPVTIVSDDSGNVYVLGASDGGYSNYNYSVVKYRRDGLKLLNAIYDYQDNPGGWDLPNAIAVDSHHAMYVTGMIENWDDDDLGTVKFSPLGDTVWSDIYTNGGEEEACAVAVDRFGNAFVEGSSESDYFDFVTLKYDPNGVRRWIARWQVGPERDDAESARLILDRLHNIYVCGSAFRGNDWRDYVIVKYAPEDVGVSQILAPLDTVRVNRRVNAQAMVKNYSSLTLSFSVRIEVSNGLYGQTDIANLAPYESTLITFPQNWVFQDSGTFGMKAYTQLTGDEEPGNDTAYATIVATFPWLVKPNVPFGSKSRKVKDGAALAAYPDSNWVYAMKGNNTLEFYLFNCSTEVWASRESVPAGNAKKKVKKGSALAYGGNGFIYAFKGGRTAEFWAYNVNARTWAQKPNLPGTTKEGGAIAYVPTYNRLYVLQGSNLQNFWAYNMTGDTWSNRSMVPLGTTNKKPKDGSSLAYDGVSTIYMVKGKTNEFFKYNVNSDSWAALKPIPLIGQLGKKKKTGAGGSMAYASDMIYVFKGNNTNEFWAYNPPLDSWVESDSLLSGLSRKRVKGGGSLVRARNKIYALKGNNTFEFFMYNADVHGLFGTPAPAMAAQTASLSSVLSFSLAVTPNPFRGSAMVTYSLPREGNVSLRLYDVTGSLVTELASGRHSSGVYRVRLDDRHLATGVYFVKTRFDDGVTQRQLTDKVLVQK